jgi:hypothetical protein
MLVIVMYGVFNSPGYAPGLPFISRMYSVTGFVLSESGAGFQVPLTSLYTRSAVNVLVLTGVVQVVNRLDVVVGTVQVFHFTCERNVIDPPEAIIGDSILLPGTGNTSRVNLFLGHPVDVTNTPAMIEVISNFRFVSI